MLENNHVDLVLSIKEITELYIKQQKNNRIVEQHVIKKAPVYLALSKKHKNYQSLIMCNIQQLL